MKIIANFAYAGTSKYVSHAVENDRTLCGMAVDELFSRVGQEWDYISEIYSMVPKELNHRANEVGCVKCLRLLTKCASDLTCTCREPEDNYNVGICRRCGLPIPPNH